MIESLSPATRKFAAIGLVIILVLVILNIIVLPLTDRHAAGEAAIGEARRQIAVYRQLLARGPALKAQVDNITDDPLRRRGFLEAASPALAGAHLESMLKAIVQSSGGTLGSTRMQLPTGDGPERVRVSLDFTADPRGLLTIIQKIEGAVPWLITANVHIRAGPVRDGEASASTARMDVDAFVWRTEL